MDNVQGSAASNNNLHKRMGMLSVAAGLVLVGGAVVISTLLLAPGGDGRTGAAPPRAQDASRDAVRAVAPGQPLLVQNLPVDTSREIPEDVRRQSVRQFNDAGTTAGPGATMVYQNATDLSEGYYAPGAGIQIADDMLLKSFTNERELGRMDNVDVFSPSGTASYGVTLELWTDDGTGQAPLAPIAGTACAALSLPVGQIWDAAAVAGCTYGPNSGIKLPERVWLMLTFSTNDAGWVRGKAAESGFTDDFYWEDPPGSLFSWAGNPYAGFSGEIWADKQACSKPAPAGQDCWSTFCGGTEYDFTKTPIPADFFEPGSDPFTGLVQLQGATGFADTFVDRKEDMCFDDMGVRQVTSLHLKRMDLVSCQAITILVSGQATLWDIEVFLDGAQKQGTLTATKTDADGGTFDTVLPVQAGFRFTKVAGTGIPIGSVVVLLPGVQQTLTSTGTRWWQTDPPFPGTCGSGGFFPGEFDFDRRCCPESCHSSRGTAPHEHCVLPPECEPCPTEPPPLPDPHITVQGTSATFGSADVPAIPADFFSPGSDPFNGTVNLVGGPTDTLGQRSGPIVCPGAGFPRPCDPVSVELIQLDLVSSAPITVTPALTQWDVAVDLSPTGSPPLGTLDATLDHANGGTYDADIPFSPRFTFTEVGNPANVRVLDYDLEGNAPIQINFLGVDWVIQLGAGLVGTVDAPNDGNFVAGVRENLPGDPNSQKLIQSLGLSKGGGIDHPVQLPTFCDLLGDPATDPCGPFQQLDCVGSPSDLCLVHTVQVAPVPPGGIEVVACACVDPNATSGCGPIEPVPGTTDVFCPGTCAAPDIPPCQIWADEGLGPVATGKTQAPFTQWLPGTLLWCDCAPPCQPGDCPKCEVCDAVSGLCVQAFPGCCVSDNDCTGKCDICNLDTNECVKGVAGCCDSDDQCGKCEFCRLSTNTCEPIVGCCETDDECSKCEVCDAAANLCVQTFPGCCEVDTDCGGKCEICDPDTNQCVKGVPDCCTSEDQCPLRKCETVVCVLSNNTCLYSPIPGCCVLDTQCTGICDVCDLASNQCVKGIPGCCSGDAQCTGCQNCVNNVCVDNQLKCSECAGCVNGVCVDNQAKCVGCEDCVAGVCVDNQDKCIGCEDCVNAICVPDSSKCLKCEMCNALGVCVDVGPDCCTSDFECGKCELCDPLSNTCYQGVPGCCTTDDKCNDGDKCTIDICDLETNSCIHKPDPECSPVEACCLNDGRCLDVAPETCCNWGGTPQGEGTDCTTVDCPVQWIVAGMNVDIHQDNPGVTANDFHIEGVVESSRTPVLVDHIDDLFPNFSHTIWQGDPQCPVGSIWWCFSADWDGWDYEYCTEFHAGLLFEVVCHNVMIDLVGWWTIDGVRVGGAGQTAAPPSDTSGYWPILSWMVEDNIRMGVDPEPFDPNGQNLRLRNGSGAAEAGGFDIEIVALELASLDTPGGIDSSNELEVILGPRPLAELRVGGRERDLPWVDVVDANGLPISDANPIPMMPGDEIMVILMPAPPTASRGVPTYSTAEPMVIEPGGFLIAKQLLRFPGNNGADGNTAGVSEEFRWVWEIHGAHKPKQIEACCLVDGTCAELTHSQCVCQGGTPQGKGTDCTDADLNGIADECEPDECRPSNDGSGCVGPCPDGTCFGECISGAYCDDPDCCLIPGQCMCYLPWTKESIKLCGDCFGECLNGSYCDNTWDPNCCVVPGACACYLQNTDISIQLCNDNNCFGECINGSYCDGPDPDCCIAGPGQCVCYLPDHPISIKLCGENQPRPPADCVAKCVTVDPLTGVQRVTGCDCADKTTCHVDLAATPGGVGVVAGVPNNPCVVTDTGGTIVLPPIGCDYLSPDEVHEIANGLPSGTVFELASIHTDFMCRGGADNGVCSVNLPAADCEEPGGTLGGHVDCFDSVLKMNVSSTGPDLLGYTTSFDIPVACEVHSAPRELGAAVQEFDTVMFRMQGALPLFGDPDFCTLKIVAGSDNGLPSPGHTKLTRLPSGDFAVDSFFDITVRIEFEGCPLSVLDGLSGSTTLTIRMETGSSPSCVGACAADEVCEETTTVNSDGTIELCCNCRPLCEPSSQPVTQKPKSPSNRFLTVKAGDPKKIQAIRVRFVSLPPPFDIWNGMDFWAGKPQEVCENSGKGLETAAWDCPAALPTTTFWAAPLVCAKAEAHYMDWHGHCFNGECVGGLEPGKACAQTDDCHIKVSLYNEGIVPSAMLTPSGPISVPATYDIQVIHELCPNHDESAYSIPLTMIQAGWGDVCGPGPGGACTGQADGLVDVANDVLGVLDKFANVSNLQKVRADLEPGDFDQNNGPDFKVNVAMDVLHCLAAFTGSSYPFNPGDPCGKGLADGSE